MMRTITAIRANDDLTLDVSFNDGAERRYDVKPLLNCPVFAELSNVALFKLIRNGGYFVEWPNEADLSADTLYLEGQECEPVFSRCDACSDQSGRGVGAGVG